MGKDWTLYESEKEKFRALFPASVDRKYYVLPNIQEFCSDDGISPGSIVYRSKTGHFSGKLIYQISVIRVITFLGSPEDYLEDGLREIVRSIGRAEVGNKISGHFKGYPSLGYEIKADGVVITGIMMAVNNTIYDLHVEFLPGHDPGQEEIVKFVNSFEILR